MEDQFEYSQYPPKPVLPVSDHQRRRVQGVLSILLFSVMFLLFIDNDVEYLIVLLGVFLIHELGHLLAMKLLRYQESGIFFLPFMKPVAEQRISRLKQSKRALVLLAGPLPGIIAGLVLYHFGVTQDDDLLIRLSWVFLALNAFNLLPLEPMDGGKLLSTLFFEQKEVLKAVFLAISSLAMIALGIYVHSWLVGLFGLLMVSWVRRVWRIKGTRQALRQQRINFQKRYEELTDEEYWLIRREVLRRFPSRANSTSEEYRVHQNEQVFLQRVKNVLQLPLQTDFKVWGKLFVVLIWLTGLILPIYLAAKDVLFTSATV